MTARSFQPVNKVDPSPRRRGTFDNRDARYGGGAALGLRGSCPAGLRCSQPISGSRPATLPTRRSRRSSRRSSLDGPPGRPAAASVRPNEVRCSAACTAVRRIVCALRQHISSRLHPRIRLRRSIMPPAPCRPPLADVRGRARCFLESTAPHQCTCHMRNRHKQLIHLTTLCSSSLLVRPVASFCGATLYVFPPHLPSKLRPTGGVGVSPTELPATEACGPPRPRGAARGKL